MKYDLRKNILEGESNLEFSAIIPLKEQNSKLWQWLQEGNGRDKTQKIIKG